MLNVTEVNLNELREAIKALNGSDLIESKIKVIGKKKEDLLNLFAETVEAVPDEEANDLPMEVIVFYNKVFGDDEDTAPDVLDKKGENEDDEKTEEKKKPTPKKKEEEKSTPKEKKVKSTPKEKKVKSEKKKVIREKDEFGFCIGTGANLIDRAIIDSGEKGATIADMEKASGRKVGTHIHVLTKYKGLPIVKEDGRYFYRP